MAAWLALLHDQSTKARATLAHHPHSLALDTGVQLAAAAVLQIERVEVFEQGPHGAARIV
jgi:hypothetical protein